MAEQTHLTQPLSSYRQVKYDAMVQNILDTARALMREQGVAALSMQDLARHLDLRAPSLYHYFSGKMDIYDTLFRLGFTLFGEHMERYFNESLSWQQYLQSGLEGYLTFAKQNPELYQLCFERPVPGFVPSEASLQVSRSQLDRAYMQAAAYPETTRMGMTVQQTADLIIAMMHGITALHLANEPQLAIGEGRFGSLIPAATAILEKAFSLP